MSWRLVKLGELITESRIPSENPDPNRRITVRLNVLGVEKRALENEKTGATKQFIRKAGQFIYGKQNFHKGAFGIIPDELDGFESSADLPSFDVREDCLPEWIFYFFKQGGYYLELAKIARGVATQRIHPEQIYDIEIPLPDIETQKKIIASIKSVEDKGDKLKKEISHQLTLLEQLEQAILQEAVQGKLVPQDPNDEPASELLKRIKAEKATLRQAQGKGKKEKPLPPIKPEEIPFEIPENWVWCRLGEIIQYTENLDIQKYLSPDTIVNYVDIDAIDNQNFIIREAKQKSVRELSTRARRVLKPNYIVYSTVRPYLKNIAIVKDEKDNYIGSTGFNVFKTLDVELKYAFYYFLTPYVNNSFKDLMVGFNSPSITNDQFEKSLFPLPPLSEQKRIVAEIEKQLAKTKQLKEHIIANQQATEQLLKALLHQAFEVKEMEEVNS